MTFVNSGKPSEPPEEPPEQDVKKHAVEREKKRRHTLEQNKNGSLIRNLKRIKACLINIQ
jgi:hypothetical protein